MSTSLVSILMPVKNAEPYLVECLDSILNQDYTNWELIVVNDHSSDDSMHILNRYAEVDQRIKVFSNNGNGIVAALKLAFHNSKGALITRMDADDKMSPQKIQLLADHLKSKGRGHVAVGCVKYFSEDVLGDGYKKYEAWLNDLTKSESNYTEIYKECVIPSPCWMTYRDDLIDAGGFDGPYPEDYDLCFRFRNHGLKVIGVNEILHYWRDYENRTSRTDDHYADNSFLDLKVHHFIQSDHDGNNKLILWGAGKKGKRIAKLLIENRVDFLWICDNPNKIGKEIYDVVLEEIDISKINNDSQVIISVAQRGEQEKIKKQLENSDFNVFYFC
ncbi:MAG: glycosyltransferase family 2 protein [Saprospiraceae bacterium]|nr:glycosyltransferase family 2 protein [Saprospiraceae bacterium]